MTREQIAQMRVRWLPYAYLEQRTQGDVEDMKDVLDALEDAKNKLDQCYAVLSAIAGSERPLAGGAQRAAMAVLVSQGVRL